MGSENRLPLDGELYDFGALFNAEEASHCYANLLHGLAWKHDEAVIFGKHIITKRKVAWYAEKEFSYTYSNKTKIALPFTPELIELKNRVESITQEKFNSCLANLYHDGSESMAWHSDSEKELVYQGCIASLSFGATRKFSMKHKRIPLKEEMLLGSGSLIVMQGATQENWLHSLPKSRKVKEGRINLTFRQMRV